METKGRWEGRAGGGCGEPWRPRDVCEDGAATCLGEALGVRLDVSRGQMPGFQWSLQMRYVSTHLPALSSGHTPAHGSDMSPLHAVPHSAASALRLFTEHLTGSCRPFKAFLFLEVLL